MNLFYLHHGGMPVVHGLIVSQDLVLHRHVLCCRGSFFADIDQLKVMETFALGARLIHFLVIFPALRLGDMRAVESDFQFSMTLPRDRKRALLLPVSRMLAFGKGVVHKDVTMDLSKKYSYSKTV